MLEPILECEMDGRGRPLGESGENFDFSTFAGTTVICDKFSRKCVPLVQVGGAGSVAGG